jgi:transcriptional regulator with XRE-family HTH domain
MSRWKELPSALDERARQLVVQMRRLKDHSGLSLSSLQSATGYSRSSWERYLNGRALPPRQAVEELARAVGADPTRLLALHEVAREAWTQTATAVEDVDTPRPQGVRRGVLIGICAAVALGALLGALLLTASLKDSSKGANGQAAAPPHPRGAFAYEPGKTYPCKVRREGGRLYAGYSATTTVLLSAPGWDVVEAQCLLQHLGFDPGGVDGVIGPNTTRAVKRLQQKAGLQPDGVVGLQTWQVLRK